MKLVQAGFIAVNGHVFTEQDAAIYNNAIQHTNLMRDIRGECSEEHTQALNSQHMAYCIAAKII